MTIGFALSWVVIGLSAIASIFVRAVDAEVRAPAVTAGIRDLAIIAAMTQITALGYSMAATRGC